MNLKKKVIKEKNFKNLSLDEQKKMFIDVFGEEEQDTVLYGEGYGAKNTKKVVGTTIKEIHLDYLIFGLMADG